MASAVNALIAQGGGEGTDFLRAIYQGQQMAQARRQGEIQDMQLQKALREDERAQGQLNALAKLADQYQAAGDTETAGLIRAGGPSVFAKLLDQKMDPKAGYMAAGDVLYDLRGGAPKPVGGNIPMIEGRPYAPGLGTGGRGPVPTPGGGGFADRVVQRESGGDPNATNPNSTATGAGQFLESTWLDLLPRHAPGVVASVVGPNADLKNPETRAALLDLRRDPELSKTMINAYAGDNAKYLQSSGIDPTPSALMVAHFLGGAGAARFLRADPNAPATSVVSPEAVMANRSVFFDQKTKQPRTVGQLLQMAEQGTAGPGGQGGAPSGDAVSQEQPSVTPLTDPMGRPYVKDAPQGMQWGRDAQGNMVVMPIRGAGATTLSPQEAQAAGFQPGAVVQRDASGKLGVVDKGESWETWTDPQTGRAYQRSSRGELRAMPGADEPMVEVYDPNSPTGTSMVPRSQAAGKPGAPSQGMAVTTNPDGTVSLVQGRGVGGGEKPMTEGAARAGGFANRMVEAEKRIDALQGFDPTAFGEQAANIPLVGNRLASKDFQLYRQAAEDWIRAKLRKESGAVIGADEMDAEFRNYFPQFGDKPPVIEQKRRARETAMQSIIGESQGGYGKISGSQQQVSQGQGQQTAATPKTKGLPSLPAGFQLVE